MFNELYARITTWVQAAREESGQGLVEYALILVLVSVASIAMLGFLGVDVGAVFTDVSAELTALP